MICIFLQSVIGCYDWFFRDIVKVEDWQEFRLSYRLLFLTLITAFLSMFVFLPIFGRTNVVGLISMEVSMVSFLGSFGCFLVTDARKHPDTFWITIIGGGLVFMGFIAFFVMVLWNA